MYAVKVGWVGQTFALAKANESMGKKSRIRRSKEDRKAMVESFIKRYQNSNSGSFPSLNLTHKEVGGSFYTVREIVREIIQENRVLGPAKLTEDEQELDQFHEQYPLGLMSIECQNHLSSSSETHVVSNDYQNLSKELDNTLNAEVDSQQLQKLDNGKYINGDSADKEYKGVDASEPPVQVNQEILHTELRINQNLESLEDIIDASTSKVTPLVTDTVVETFPDTFASKITRGIESVEETLAADLQQPETERVKDKSVISESDYCGSLDEKSVEHLGDISTSKVTPLVTDIVVETFPVTFASKITQNMESVEETLAADLQLHETERVKAKSVISESDYSGSLDEKSVEHLGDQLVEALSSSTKSSTISTLVGDNLQTDMAFKDDSSLQTMQTTKENVEISEMELKPAPKTVHNKSSNNMGSNQGEALSQEAAAVKTKSDNESPYSKEGRNSTLNRTKLESWEGSDRLTPEAETNPLLAVVKAFISAFVKFWTE
ncbi:hypothetical protein AQUCO_01900131v1 [Aquilegia coerulea]|uniref:AT3G52170-like helix-turn-helix domain-containing protein n=1 Tax=Aquilegia coerulea TaxID=218851 RepID=A0A2G5DJ58_AQUCA|nr:hypothetical protein AQUCO_01900131v1 [Aquilegia coerulea]PIA43527.1 hypothetical protein AQUCO_01900131v1 [Aquilegia coerulea]